MQVEFLEKFNKDLEKLNNQAIKKSLIRVIEMVESTNNVSAHPLVKKLSGFKNAFRIRIGDYRIGIYIEGYMVQFARVAHRKDIYKLFP